MCELKYFPYKKVREGQDALIHDLNEFIMDKKEKVMLFDAPCGLGKESAVLSQILVGLDAGKFKKAIILVPTDAGKMNIMNEVKNIEKKVGKLNYSILFIDSKEKLCLLKKELERTAKGDDEEEEKIRANDICRVYKNKCEYFKNGTCPYYQNKGKISASDIIICDYNYVFHSIIRKNTGIGDILKEGNVFLAVNEVHKLESRIKAITSRQISSYTINKAISECETFKDKRSLAILNGIKDNIWKLSSNLKIKQGETDVDKEIHLDDIIINMRNANKLVKTGEWILSRKIETRTGGLSYTERVGEFFKRLPSTSKYGWYNYLVRKYVTKRGNTRVATKYFATSPAPTVKYPFRMAKKILLYSGTCYPERYKKMFNLFKLDKNNRKKKTGIITKEYKSPLSRKRTDVFYMDGVLDYNGRAKDNTIKKAVKDIKEMLEYTNKTVAFVCVRPLWNRINERLKIECADEPKSQEEVPIWVNKMRKEKPDYIYFTPFGRLAQSIDMSFINTIFILGIPVIKQTLEERLTMKDFTKRYKHIYASPEYVSRRILMTLPALEKSRQASGRGLRKENDDLVVIWFDRRFVEKYYYNFIKSDKKLKAIDIDTAIELLKGLRK